MLALLILSNEVEAAAARSGDVAACRKAARWRAATAITGARSQTLSTGVVGRARVAEAAAAEVPVPPAALPFPTGVATAAAAAGAEAFGAASASGRGKKSAAMMCLEAAT